jgi:hypothetical protein
MAFADMTIPGVAGTISTQYGFWSGYRFTIGGQRVKPHGFPRRLTLPGADGPIEAKLKGGWLSAHPVLIVGGAAFSTGPVAPRVQRILAVLPLAAFLLVQGALGALLAVGGTAINMGIVRSERPGGAKVALMVANLVAVVVIDLVLAIAVTSALNA